MCVCVQTLKHCQFYNSRCQRLQARPGQLLNGHMAHEMVNAESAVLFCSACGWQDVICAAAIITDRFRRPRTQEYRTRVANFRQFRPWIIDLQYQMFRRVLIADENGIAQARDENQALINSYAI